MPNGPYGEAEDFLSPVERIPLFEEEYAQRQAELARVRAEEAARLEADPIAQRMVERGPLGVGFDPARQRFRFEELAALYGPAGERTEREEALMQRDIAALAPPPAPAPAADPYAEFAGWLQTGEAPQTSEGMKLAAQHMGKEALRQPNLLARAEEATGPRLEGETNQAYQSRVLQKYSEVSGEKAMSDALARLQAEREMPRVAAGTRADLADLDVRISEINRLRRDFDPIWTGVEAAPTKLRMLIAAGSPEVARYNEWRAGAQLAFAQTRTDLIGAAQTESELRAVELALPIDITRLTDAQVVSVLKTAHRMATKKRDAIQTQFNIKQPTPAMIRTEETHPLTGKPAGRYRNPETGETVMWDGEGVVR